MISGIGEILWDIYPEERFIGGAVANVIQHLHILGDDAILVSAIGDDEDGRMLIEQCRKMNLDTKYIEVMPERKTGSVRVELDSDMKPTFTAKSDAAYDYFRWNDEWSELASRSDAVIYGTFAQRTESSTVATQKYIEYAEHATKIFDLNIRAWNQRTKDNIYYCMEAADILKLNDEELIKIREILPEMSSDAIEACDYLFEKFNLKLCCLTLGANGAYGVTSADRYYAPGYNIVPVDTTGAGDAFTASVAHSFCKGDVKNIIDKSNSYAAVTTMYVGAVKNLGSVEKLEGCSRRFDPNFEKYYR